MPTRVPSVALPQVVKANWWTIEAWLVDNGYLDGDALEVLTVRSMRALTLVPIKKGKKGKTKKGKPKKRGRAVKNKHAGLESVRFTIWVAARRAAPVIINDTLSTLNATETADITVTVPGAQVFMLLGSLLGQTPDAAVTLQEPAMPPSAYAIR